MDIHSIDVLLKLYNKQSQELESMIRDANSVLEKHRHARNLRKLKEKMRTLEDERRRIQQGDVS